MRLGPVFAAVTRRTFMMFRSYSFNSISSLVTMYIVFLLLFFGAKAVGGPVLSSAKTLDAMVVGYFIWLLAVTSYSDLSWDLTNEAQVGTLEQLYLSPVGYKWISFFVLMSNAVLVYSFNVIFLLLMMVTTGKYLRLDLISLVPILAVTIAGVYGIGYMLGGLALVFKRIQSFFQVMQFLMVAFLLAPVDRYLWAKLLPLGMGNHLAAEVMVGGKHLWQLPPADLLYLTASSAFYLVLGLAVFTRCEKAAKKAGLLGQY